MGIPVITCGRPHEKRKHVGKARKRGFWVSLDRAVRETIRTLDTSERSIPQFHRYFFGNDMVKLKNLDVKSNMLKLKNLDVTSNMEKNVRLETEGTLFYDLPGELLMSIFALLPIRRLMRIRTVCRRWNAIVLDPQFHRIRSSLCREFIERVLRSFWFIDNYSLTHSVKGFLFLERGRHEIYVMRPSKLSIRQLPALDCTLDTRRLQVEVVDVVLDETTMDYVVFACSEVYIALPSMSDEEIRKTPKGPVRRKNLHHYDSATGVWSLCGSGGLNLNMGNYADEVTVHRDLPTALIMNFNNDVLDLNDREIPHRFARRYEILCHRESRWETLPRGFLRNVPHGDFRNISLFDHRGALYVALSAYGVYSLEKYGDETKEWVLTCDFRSMVRQNEQNPQYFDHQYDGFPYVKVLGDYLHLGIDIPRAFSREGRCQRMTYNLVSGEFGSMSRDESQVMLVGPRGTFLFQPE